MDHLAAASLAIALLSLAGTWIQVWQGRTNALSVSSSTDLSSKNISFPRAKLVSIALTATVAVLFALLGVYLTNPHYEKLPDEKLISIVGKQFVNEIVDVDGKHFENCRFISVTLHLSGKHNSTMVKNSFQGPLRITFDSEVNSQASSVVVAMLQQAGMITSGRVGFIQPNDSVVILKDDKQ